MSSVLIEVFPIAKGLGLPSANMATTVPFSHGVIRALGWVRPERRRVDGEDRCGVSTRPTWTHDVGAREDELYCSFVHHLGGQQEGELVEQSQCGDPWFIVMPDRTERYQQ